ncbi:MAG TPA: maltose alpha-D-glucosyltransferase [Gemmatimonadota bacterium]
MSGDPLWYKDAIFYELRVRSFFDSDGDGLGDLRGLTQKLDYLQDLGVTTLWLLPFYPSPMRDDGYDIADYTRVDPDSGTLPDFKVFLREAHRRGLRVVTEIVLNHTSDQHPWFRAARTAPPGDRRRDWYVWSDTPDRYADARIIFKDFESSNWAWDPAARAYYWHRFFSHQPDLNYDNPDVRKAVRHVVDFWLGMGVDGFRLDAVPYLHEREGTSCENLPATHAFLRDLRSAVDSKYPGRMLLAEANQWPEDAAAYFGAGDECHMAFHFPIMPRLFMSLHMEDRFPLVDILEQTPAIPDVCQWAIFLRNHDELTLEMVTDEERDYMYRYYASDARARINLGIRRRLAPLLGNGRRRIELLNALLFSLPGTPVLYYGDEIGMGDNIYLGDRNGVRTPMQWSADRNAGFSRANPQRLYLPVIIDPEYNYETVNVEAQQANRHSLLWWMKRVIALRRRHRAFSRGTIEVLHPRNRKVLAFLRRHEDETMLVVANLSRFVQYVELDLAAFAGWSVVELFGRTPLPSPEADRPWVLTLGPHGFYWFALERARQRVEGAAPAAFEPPLVEIRGGVETAFAGEARAALEAALPGFLRGQRWFGGKARSPRSAAIREAFPLPAPAAGASLVLADLEYEEGVGERYALVLAAAHGAAAEELRARTPGSVLARVRPRGRSAGEEGLIHEAVGDPAVHEALLALLLRKSELRGAGSDLVPAASPALRGARGAPSRVVGSEQSNTSILFDDRAQLKLLRRVPDGTSPEVEVGRFLTERARFTGAPALLGWLEVRPPRGEAATLAVVHAFVPNEGVAWELAVDEVRRFVERALTRPASEAPAGTAAGLAGLAGEEAPPLAHETIGTFLESARLLGQRTAQMHRALASDRADPAFAPEPFTPFVQRALYQSLRNRAASTLRLLREAVAASAVPAEAADDAARVLRGGAAVVRAFRPVLDRRLSGSRIRVHGDYHLGQVLHTGRDFVVLDFEGEPARTLAERRLKRSPLLDVAGMLRSFGYAARAALDDTLRTAHVRREDAPALEPWLAFWVRWTGGALLRAYLQEMEGTALLPATAEERAILLHALLLEKALYEIGYELNNRPAWVGVPLRGVVELAGLTEAAA